MKQISYSYECQFDNKFIGDGICCKVCKNFVRSTEPDKVCIFEKVISKYVRDV